MNKREQKSLHRLWATMVNGGIPLSDAFEINVVLAHVEWAFKSGLRLGKQRQHCPECMRTRPVTAFECRDDGRCVSCVKAAEAMSLYSC